MIHAVSNVIIKQNFEKKSFVLKRSFVGHLPYDCVFWAVGDAIFFKPPHMREDTSDLNPSVEHQSGGVRSPWHTPTEWLNWIKNEGVKVSIECFLTPISSLVNLGNKDCNVDLNGEKPAVLVYKALEFWLACLWALLWSACLLSPPPLAYTIRDSICMFLQSHACLCNSFSYLLFPVTFSTIFFPQNFAL